VSAREAALKILVDVDKGNEFSDSILRKQFNPKRLSLLDQNLTRELVAGVLRRRTKLDWVLNGSLKKGLHSLNPMEQNILRLGLYQIAFLDKIPIFAAVNESVKLVKRFGRKEIIGLTNAVLRDIIRNGKHLKKPDTGDKTLDASIEYSHPEWLVKRWQREIGWENTIRLMEFNNAPAPVIIRVNSLKTTTQALFERLTAGGFQPEMHDSVPSAMKIQKPSGLVDNELFVRGHFYFQDVSAQAVGMLYRAGLGSSILDLCAAPGGKAGAAIELSGGKAQIFAADINHKKLGRVKGNFTRLGLNSWHLINADAATIKFKEKFDLVLADVPCTGLGVIRRRLDLRWRVKESDIGRMAGLQTRILDNAADLVKPGGALVYSTCTVTPEENRDQITGFLARHTGFSLDPAEKYIPASLVKDGCMETWPHINGMDGAFAARLVNNTKNI
jgi:16S rRNA (cytosine967-C5)-methyltransferase